MFYNSMFCAKALQNLHEPGELSIQSIKIREVFLSSPYVMDISRVMISDYTLLVNQTVLSNQLLGSKKEAAVSTIYPTLGTVTT